MIELLNELWRPLLELILYLSLPIIAWKAGGQIGDWYVETYLTEED